VDKICDWSSIGVWRDRHLLIPVMAELASTGRLLSVVGGDGLDRITICVGRSSLTDICRGVDEFYGTTSLLATTKFDGRLWLFRIVQTVLFAFGVRR